MATQSKKEKVSQWQVVPAPPAPAEATVHPTPQQGTQAAETSPPPGEPIAQFEATRGDRIAYAVWLIGAGILFLHFVCDTVLGLLFRR